MSKQVPITNHFIARYRERVAKTTPERIGRFANDAYINGKDGDEIKSGQLRKLLIRKTEASDVIVKIYKGFVYVFSEVDNAAITIYRLPKQINGIPVHI